MDPPRRLPSARRSATLQKTTPTTTGLSSKTLEPDNKSANLDHEPKASRPAGQEWEESETRLHIEVAECIETKTVTTTTTTKRQYPPLIVRPPRSLRNLNTKEYPLATQRTPQELTNFSYKVGDTAIHFREDGPSTPQSIHEAQSHGSFATPSLRHASRELQRIENATAEPFILNQPDPPRSPDSSNPFEGRIRPRPSQPQRQGTRSSQTPRMKGDMLSSFSSPKSALLSRTKSSEVSFSDIERTAAMISSTRWCIQQLQRKKKFAIIRFYF